MKKIFLLAAATLALAACNNDDNPTDQAVAAHITATICESLPTRASDNSWGSNDKIGISSTVGPFINLEYTTEKGDGTFTGTPIFFYKKMTLTAYYPFTDDEGTAPGTDGIITADTRAENQTAAKQPYIDFLWDTQTGFTTQDPNVNFKFAHKMSKVTFTFQSSKEVIVNGITIAGPVNVRDMVHYTINGLVLDGTFNTATGECAVKDDTDEEPLTIDVKDKSEEKIEDDETVTITVPSLILFPQTFSGGIPTLDIYTDELEDLNNLQHYKCNLAFSNGEIKPGYHYKYTIKVSKIGLIVGEMTVEPWVESERFLIATIDGDKVFKEQE